MKFFNFSNGGAMRLGADVDGKLIDVTGLMTGKGVSVTCTDELIGGPDLTAVTKALDGVVDEQYVLLASTVKWLPAITKPEKILCLGFNYRRHAEETNTPLPKFPILFNKYNNALSGHGAVIALPDNVASEFDYEAELVIVIGKEAYQVNEKEALDYVFGYATGNDICARELQIRTAQFMLGKTSDGFAPIGPYVVTADEVPDPDGLDIGCWVNGEQRQNSNTKDMIFKCAFTVSYISQYMTLKPGDVIFMGTPEGVILGYPKDKKVWLKAGDEVTTELKGLGRQTVTLGSVRQKTA